MVAPALMVMAAVMLMVARRRDPDGRLGERHDHATGQGNGGKQKNCDGFHRLLQCGDAAIEACVAAASRSILLQDVAMSLLLQRDDEHA